MKKVLFNMEQKKIKKVFIDGAISSSFIGDSIAQHSSKKNIGAHSIFLGQVRSDLINGKEVIAIEYSAYREMADEKFQEIREAAFEKYNLTCMHIYHSVGKVNAGQICLFVFTSSPHRAEATKACSEIVEKIKHEVPVWGKELFDDDNFQWKKNTTSG